MATLAGQPTHHQPTTVEEVRTLWIGDLQYWVDESYLNSCFAHTGEVISIKIIRNKITGQPEGYGFVEFVSHAAAERILQTYNGTQMPGTEQTFRLNWASFGIGERRPDAGPEHSIFVGDLAPDVTDYLLQETFRAQYPSVRGAKVVTDPNTGRSKGYGFVKFADENERNRAMSEMNGVYCSTRPMRISAATPKKTIGVQQQYSLGKAMYPVPAYTTSVPVLPADYDANNTTLVNNNKVQGVGGKPSYGIDVKFLCMASAEEAIQKMQGKIIGQQVVRTSWGRNPAAKQDLTTWGQQVDPNQWSAYYGYGGTYDAYGYGVVQDPSLYGYGAYSGYASYPQQVDGVQDLATVAGAVPSVEQGEEWNDTLDTPDVDWLAAREGNWRKTTERGCQGYVLRCSMYYDGALYYLEMEFSLSGEHLL
uniref:RRM domain-containing protein n=1 Tax=Cucumis sativus TaxID=3659 RepID=A0A0A0KKV7_CUCSA